jgi:hypothetical protein
VSYRPELQCKQFVSELNGALCRFRVFTTGSDRHYLFAPVGPMSLVMQPFPVLKRDLRNDVRSALAHGWRHA